MNELNAIPSKLSCIKSDEIVKEIAVKYQDVRNILYLGHGYNYPVAMEGALVKRNFIYTRRRVSKC